MKHDAYARKGRSKPSARIPITEHHLRPVRSPHTPILRERPKQVDVPLPLPALSNPRQARVQPLSNSLPGRPASAKVGSTVRIVARSRSWVVLWIVPRIESGIVNRTEFWQKTWALMGATEGILQGTSVNVVPSALVRTAAGSGNLSKARSAIRGLFEPVADSFSGVRFVGESGNHVKMRVEDMLSRHRP